MNRKDLFYVIFKVLGISFLLNSISSLLFFVIQGVMTAPYLGNFGLDRNYLIALLPGILYLSFSYAFLIKTEVLMETFKIADPAEKIKSPRIIIIEYIIIFTAIREVIALLFTLPRFIQAFATNSFMLLIPSVVSLVLSVLLIKYAKKIAVFIEGIIKKLGN